ncbi:hypothetical protein C8K36_10674 [Rhodococcus sp. OK519]|nr:hypothetical protein C8K36_10674 [Rhodococcus sp. OK519]
MTDQKGIPVGGNHKTRTAEWIGSIHTRVGRRFRRPSPRTVLALATVPAVVVGLAQFSDTSAAFTDSAMANSSMSSAAKLLPAVASSGCDTTGSPGFRNARLKWPHIGTPFKYRVIVYQLNGNVSHTSNVIDPGTASAGTQFTYEIDDSEVGIHTGWEYVARIYTVNPAGEQSTDWRGSKLKQPTTNSVECNGDTSSISAANGTEVQALRMGAPPSETPATTEPTTVGKSSTTTAPSTTTGTTSSTTTGTTTSGTTSTGTTTSETNATTTEKEAATATTTPPESSTTTASATASKPVKSASGEYSAAVLTDGTGTHLVVYGNSDEKRYRTVVPVDSTLTWLSSGDIRITNATGTETVSSDNWTK